MCANLCKVLILYGYERFSRASWCSTVNGLVQLLGYYAFAPGSLPKTFDRSTPVRALIAGGS